MTILQFDKFNTGKGIGVERTKTICEFLKVNTTIRSLDLSSLLKRMHEIENWGKRMMAGNEIGDEGAKALSEMLNVNRTLTSLNLGSVEERERVIKREKEKE